MTAAGVDHFVLTYRHLWRHRFEQEGLVEKFCRYIEDEVDDGYGEHEAEFRALFRLKRDTAPTLEEYTAIRGRPGWEIEAEQVDVDFREAWDELERVSEKAELYLAEQAATQGVRAIVPPPAVTREPLEG